MSRPSAPPPGRSGYAPGASVPARGRWIVRASLTGTVVFVLTAVLAAAAGRGPLRGLAAVVAVGLFAVGSLAYLAGYARAVQRSRSRVIDMAGLVFLAHCAPAPVRRLLLGATLVEVVAALVTAAVRPFTTLAFGVLAPVFGLGLQTLWAAHHGDFPPRPPEVRTSGRARGPGGPGKDGGERDDRESPENPGGPSDAKQATLGSAPRPSRSARSARSSRSSRSPRSPRSSRRSPGRRPPSTAPPGWRRS